MRQTATRGFLVSRWMQQDRDLNLEERILRKRESGEASRSPSAS